MQLKEPDFCIQIGSMTFHERADGGTAMLAATGKCKTGTITEIGFYKGFTIAVEKNFMEANYIIFRGKVDYYIDLSTSPVGSMVRLENVFNEMQQKITFYEQKQKIRERYRASNDNIRIIPAREKLDIFQDTSHKRVGVYARVSTDNEEQTSSFELQKQYYTLTGYVKVGNCETSSQS